MPIGRALQTNHSPLGADMTLHWWAHTSLGPSSPPKWCKYSCEWPSPKSQAPFPPVFATDELYLLLQSSGFGWGPGSTRERTESTSIAPTHTHMQEDTSTHKHTQQTWLQKQSKDPACLSLVLRLPLIREDFQRWAVLHRLFWWSNGPFEDLK